eukprot:scaffold7366_cov254-Pinguiococcus_pyrenoidosus.AAC.24
MLRLMECLSGIQPCGAALEDPAANHNTGITCGHKKDTQRVVAYLPFHCPAVASEESVAMNGTAGCRVKATGPKGRHESTPFLCSLEQPFGLLSSSSSSRKANGFSSSKLSHNQSFLPHRQSRHSRCAALYELRVQTRHRISLLSTLALALAFSTKARAEVPLSQSRGPQSVSLSLSASVQPR